MFIFSIVPFSISSDSNGKPQNLSNSVEAIEDQIMKLEQAITAKLLMPNAVLSSEYEITGIGDPNNISIEDLKESLDEARNTEIGLLSSGAQDEEDDYTARSQEITSKIFAAELREKDLQNLLQFMQENPNSYVPEISGVVNAVMVPRSDPYNGFFKDVNYGYDIKYTADPNVVSAALEDVQAFKAELTSSKTFWGKVASLNGAIDGSIETPEPIGFSDYLDFQNSVWEEITSLGDAAEAEFVNSVQTRLVNVQDLLYKLITDPTSDMPEISGVTYEIPDESESQPDGTRNTSDAAAAREAIKLAQEALLSKLTDAQNEPWFNEVINTIESRNEEVNTKITSAVEKMFELQDALVQMIQNPNATLEEIPGLTYEIDDPNVPGGKIITSDSSTLRRTLYETRAYLGELITENQFLVGIINPEMSVIPEEVLNELNERKEVDSTEIVTREQRVKELEDLLVQINNNGGNPIDTDPTKEGNQFSGLPDNYNVSDVTSALYVARATLGELKSEKKLLDTINEILPPTSIASPMPMPKPEPQPVPAPIGPPIQIVPPSPDGNSTVVRDGETKFGILTDPPRPIGPPIKIKPPKIGPPVKVPPKKDAQIDGGPSGGQYWRPEPSSKQNSSVNNNEHIASSSHNFFEQAFKKGSILPNEQFEASSISSNSRPKRSKKK